MFCLFGMGSDGIGFCCLHAVQKMDEKWTHSASVPGSARAPGNPPGSVEASWSGISPEGALAGKGGVPAHSPEMDEILTHSASAPGLPGPGVSGNFCVSRTVL